MPSAAAALKRKASAAELVTVRVKSIGEPNAANYDPAKANPYPDWLDVLTLKNGRNVTTAEMWWQKRRPEIALDFEREIYGRVPKDVPKVTWTVAETVETTVGGQPVVARRVIGHVDNSAHPAVAVDIKMAVVVPVRAEGPVPVLMMFGGGNMPGESRPRFPGAQEPAAPPSTDQLIAAGWGYVSLSTASIQADNGAGLTSGIIGLTNKGQRRTPEQWGSLRAWAWGAARALDVNGRAEHFRERFLDDLLDGERIRLALPAGIARAEVLEREEEAHLVAGYR